MFVYSLRASTLKFFGVTTLAIVALVTLLVFIPTAEPVISDGVLEAVEEVHFDKIKTAEDRIAFLRQFGWEVETVPVEEAEVTIPAEFDKVYQSYNELQKRQGLDLLKYKNKRVTRYTYKVTNYKSEGEVWANLFVYRGKIIACDVSSADPTGFVIPMTLVDRSNLK